MTSYNAANLIATTISSYTANPSSVHEQLSRIDFVARLALALSAPAALSNPDFKITMQCSPGYGALRGALISIEEHAGQDPFTTIARIGQELLSARVPSPDPTLQTVEALRNHLFHGGALPEPSVTAQIASALVATVEEASTRLVEALSSASIDADASLMASGISEPILHVGGNEYTLYPLMALRVISNTVFVFSRVTSKWVVLNAAKHEQSHLIQRGEIDPLLRRLFRLNQLTDTLMSDYIQTALEDLEGFKELGTSISSVTESDGVIVRWTHAKGGEQDSRQDRLRIGPDNTWQWHDGSDWRGYTELLRSLANWPMLTQRLKYILEERISEAKENENEMLPLPADVSPRFVPPMVRVAAIGARPEEYTLDRFTARLDVDVKANRGTTYLYFVHAEAGAGKTTALLRTARKRVEDCIAGKASQQPLFLYVSAKGNVLENLDMAVDATVTATHLLTSDSVRALCRNGLIIPIVDGFDELVGSPTYADALASLRPWLQSLGGRGVLVVSARSNYFVSLYEESIRRETNKDINVEHLIAELARWKEEERDNYLIECGVERSQLRRLPQAELEMLRLPFFARASIGYLRGRTTIPHRGLVRELMRGYIEREQAKLQGPTGETLVAAEDLENFFEELAAFMMEYNTREVPLDDLTLNAEFALGTLSPDVRNRLVALCGLDISGGRDRRFRFMHEIILDYFFGQRVGRDLCGEKIAELQRILSRSQLTPGASRVAISMCDPNPARLTSLMRHEPGPAGVAPLKANVGALWSEVFASGHPISAVEIVGVEFPPMEVSNRALNSVRFVKCNFASLTLVKLDSRNVRFTECNFQKLRLEGSGQGITFDKCVADEVSTLTPSAYAEVPEEVNRALRNAGATVVAADPGARDSQSNLARQAQFFLERIHRRANPSIVVDADSLPVDRDRFGWITRNETEWLAFIKALEDHGLASLEQIEASGAPKWRLRWTNLPESILSRNISERPVREFWSALEGGVYD